MLLNTQSRVVNDPDGERREVLERVVGLTKGELIYKSPGQTGA